MNRMIKDHSGSWMLSSGILTLYALAAYFGKTPGCNKSLCLSYGEQGRHSVYFAEDEVADSVRIGYEFVHDGAACGAYETEVAELLHRMERFVEEELPDSADRDRAALAALWEASNRMRCAYLALYQLTNESFFARAYEEVEEFLSAQSGVIDRQEVLQCLSAVDTRELYIFRERADWLSLARRYLDAGKALDEDLLQRLAEHARRYGFLRMGRSPFMAGADAADYREKLTAYTEEDYEKERAQYALQLESAVHTEERAERCARLLGMPQELYRVIRRLAKLAQLRLQMREVSQKLIVAREKTLMPQVYRWIHRNFDDQEFRFLLPEEIADMVREEQPERFYQDRKAEVRKRREAVCMELREGGIRVTSGEAARERFRSYPTAEAARASVYRGIPVCGKGAIVGPVIQLDENATRPEAAQGRIVLCRSLIPNMVGACVRALAVITEEGGYSSHASVLCREMHIACIVGARGVLALRDGETVRMDLETGGIQRCEAAPAPAAPVKLPCFVPLRDAEEAMPVGGKARQLCRIRESTPDAFLITTEGFALLAEDPEAFARQLAARLRALGAESVILRSSFAEEDSQEKTYAGIFESYGNVDARDGDRILGIVRKMIAAYQNVPGFYQTEHDGLENCSIVVQRMLSPTISGVAISGYVHKGYEQILIEYVLGHLSVLMDGKVTPMRSFFRKAAYYEQPGAPREWMPPFLVPSHSHLLDELIDHVVRLEAAYTGSIEIEWAMDGEKLYLLQVRKEPTRG